VREREKFFFGGGTFSDGVFWRVLSSIIKRIMCDDRIMLLLMSGWVGVICVCVGGVYVCVCM
jgi:hypothetical protein